jgi:hypothetical protein
MYDGYLEINVDRFETADYVFNKFRDRFEPKDYDISLDDVDEDFCIYALEYYDIYVTREDIKNNEKLREILENVARGANYNAEIAGFSEGYQSAYIEYFDKYISDFLENNGVYGYAHNIQVSIDYDYSGYKVFKIEYEFDDDNVRDLLFLGREEEEGEFYKDDYDEFKEDYIKSFRYSIEGRIVKAIGEFDNYMGRKIAKAKKAKTREFFDEDASNEEFKSSFIEYLRDYLDDVEYAIESAEEDEDNEDE